MHVRALTRVRKYYIIPGAPAGPDSRPEIDRDIRSLLRLRDTVFYRHDSLSQFDLHLRVSASKIIVPTDDDP